MRAVRVVLAAVLGLSLQALGCAPDFDVRNSVVDEERILAVVAEPPEARPGALVRYTALAAGPDGRVSSNISWTYCTSPKPPGENNVVSTECLKEPGVPLAGAGSERAEGRIPGDACARFGPDPPPGDARPRDPDRTGGFYQPLRLDAFQKPWVALERIQCSPGNAPNDVAREFLMRYTPNQNPILASFTAFATTGPELGEIPVSPAGGEHRLVRARETIELRASLGPASREPFVRIDASDARLLDDVESLRAAWFATRGSLAADRGDLPAEEREFTNIWQVPDEPGDAFVWVIVHDSRGGTAVGELAFRAE